MGRAVSLAFLWILVCCSLGRSDSDEVRCELGAFLEDPDGSHSVLIDSGPVPPDPPIRSCEDGETCARVVQQQIILLALGVSQVLADGYGYGYKPSYSHPEAVYDYHEKPQPYSFGYETKDAYGNKQFRQEDSDASGAKKGSYGYTDAHGIYRTVEYIADKNGFRAWIKTNEPGTANQNPADVEVNAVEAPVVHHAAPAYASAPVHYSAPVPVHYDSYGSAPVLYKAPVAYKAPVVYKSAPVIYKSPAPVSYKSHAAPVSYKSHAAPVSYKSHAAPVSYKSHAAPVVYKAPVAYKTPIYTASSPAVYKLPAHGYKPHYRKYDDIY